MPQIDLKRGCTLGSTFCGARYHERRVILQRCAVLALALTDAHMRQTTQQRCCICGDDRGDLPFGTPLIYPLLPNGLEPQMLDFLVVLSVRGDSSAELSLSLQVSLEMHTDGGLISWSHVHVFFARTMSSHRSGLWLRFLRGAPRIQRLCSRLILMKRAHLNSYVV